MFRVYFGTPYPSYRAALLARYPRQVSVPAHYDWNLREGKASVAIDLSASGSPHPLLKPGQLPYRALFALAADLYKPIRVAALHAKLYPGQVFNPFSSPGKVHQAVLRVKAQWRRAGLGVSISSHGGGYDIEPNSPCALRIYRDAMETGRGEWFFAKLREARMSDFTSEEAARVLHLPFRSAQRVLSEMTEAGRLARRKVGRDVRYALK